MRKILNINIQTANIHRCSFCLDCLELLYIFGQIPHLQQLPCNNHEGLLKHQFIWLYKSAAPWADSAEHVGVILWNIPSLFIKLSGCYYLRKERHERSVFIASLVKLLCSYYNLCSAPAVFGCCFSSSCTCATSFITNVCDLLSDWVIKVSLLISWMQSAWVSKSRITIGHSKWIGTNRRRRRRR